MPKCNLEEVVFECLTPKREALAKEIIIDGLKAIGASMTLAIILTLRICAIITVAT